MVVRLRGGEKYSFLWRSRKRWEGYIESNDYQFIFGEKQQNVSSWFENDRLLTYAAFWLLLQIFCCHWRPGKKFRSLRKLFKIFDSKTDFKFAHFISFRVKVIGFCLYFKSEILSYQISVLMGVYGV